MANKHKKIDADELIELANKYCDECIGNRQEQATGSGKIVEVTSRHIPTIAYFVCHWLRRQHFEFYNRTTIYRVLKDEQHPLCDTIKKIQGDFDSLAVDIVANEGKGIFYAKNRLGMTDKQQISGDPEQPLFPEL